MGMMEHVIICFDLTLIIVNIVRTIMYQDLEA